MRWVLIGLVRVYQYTLSPLLGQVCRYYPSCSHYAVGALYWHGAIRGSWLTVRRLGRCHPWAAGGVDHVPPVPPVDRVVPAVPSVASRAPLLRPAPAGGASVPNTDQGV